LVISLEGSNPTSLASKNNIVMNTYHTLITHKSRVLLLENRSTWILPVFTFAESYFWQDVGHINQAVNEHLGIIAITLNCIAIIKDAEKDETRYYYALEACSATRDLSIRGRWFTHLEIESRPQNEQRDVVCAWFRYIEANPSPENRVPWYLPGWKETAQRWVADQCKELGLSITGRMVQIRSWQRASIWRIPTQDRVLYFKAVPPMFDFEPRLTHTLAEWFPGSAPRILRTDVQNHWFLMQSAGERSLTNRSEIAQWEGAIRSFAQMQIDLVDRTTDLLALGIPDRQLEHFPNWIDELLADTAALRRGDLGLLDDEISRLQNLRPQIKEIAIRLKESGIPASLEHGDFWSGQVLLDATERPTFIDWSDSSISHPFLSTWFFLVEVAYELPGINDAYTRLRQAYLQPWLAYGSMNHLLDTFELAQLLSPIHHALIYHRLILPNMEIKWEMERMLPQSLRKLLGEDG
jgi:hypothetical protein